MSRAPLGKHTVPGGLLEKLADPLRRDQVQPGNLPEQASELHLQDTSALLQQPCLSKCQSSKLHRCHLGANEEGMASESTALKADLGIWMATLSSDN